MGSKILSVFKNPSFRLILLLYIVSALFLLIGVHTYITNNYSFFAQNLSKGKTVVIKINNNLVKLGTVGFNNSNSNVKKIDAGSTISREKNGSTYHDKPLEEYEINIPKVGILLGELGLDKTLTSKALNFENKIALGFSPYADDVSTFIDKAAELGFESYIQIPMQPVNYPSHAHWSHALLHNLSVHENLDKLNWILSKSNRLVGGYSLEDETFTNSETNVLPIFELLNNRQLSFLYGGKTNLPSLEKLSFNMKFDFIGVDINLDESLSELEMKAGLSKLENLAKTQGFAVGKIRPSPLSIHVLKEWLNGLNTKEVVLVPISNLFKFKVRSIAKNQTSITNALNRNTTEVIKENIFENNLNKNDSLSNQIKMIELNSGKVISEEEYENSFSKNIKITSEENSESKEENNSTSIRRER